MRFAAFSWSALALSYLLFAGQLTRNELVAGFGASLAIAAYAVIAHRMTESPMRLRLRWDRVIRAAAISLVVDTMRAGVALLRPAPGTMSHQVLPPGGRAPSARHALAILALSVAPNGFVVRVKADQALLHQMVPTEQREPLA